MQGARRTGDIVAEAMQFDRGYLSPYFVTKPERMEAILEDIAVLAGGKRWGERSSRATASRRTSRAA